MVELGELEKSFSEFAKRDVRIVVISNDDLETAKETQADFKNLLVVSDADQKVANSMEVIHPGVGPQGKDTNAPTTFLVDGDGRVKWFVRPTSFMVRLSPKELLAAIDATWPS